MPTNTDDDLFNLDDYVPPGGGLPEHLKGKSAEEVAQYYSGQLRTANEKVKERPPAAPAAPPTQPVNAPLTQADVAPAMGTMIAAAKMVAKATLDADGQSLWDRFQTDITNIMQAGFKGAQLADAQNWIFAYNQVMGAKASQLRKEASEAAISRRTAETSSSTPSAPAAEITLEPVQEELAVGLGLGSEGFKQGIKTSRENKWPLTFSNR